MQYTTHLTLHVQGKRLWETCLTWKLHTQARGSTFIATLSQKMNMCIAIGNIPQRHNPESMIQVCKLSCSWFIRHYSKNPIQFIPLLNYMLKFSRSVCQSSWFVCRVFANACVAHSMHVNTVAYMAVRRDMQMQHADTPACYNHNADNARKQNAPMEKTYSQEPPGSMSYIQQPISSRDSACHFALRNSLHPSSMSELRHPHLKMY